MITLFTTLNFSPVAVSQMALASCKTPISEAAAITEKDLEAQRSLLDKIKALAKALAAKLHTLKDATSEKAKKAYAEYAKQKDVLDQKLQQAQRAFDDMQDYLKRLKAKLADMQKVVAQTEKKFGESASQTKTVKKRFNDLYSSFYGKNHYKEA